MKTFLLSVAMILLASQSWGDWLYFELPTQKETPINYDYASVRVEGMEEALWGETKTEEGEIVETDLFDYGAVGRIDLDGLGDIATYSFYIELYTFDASAGTLNTVGVSTPQLGATLAPYIGTETNPTPSAYWHGEGYSVPEPTSGMMLLLGIGLLGLRRRRMKEVA